MFHSAVPRILAILLACFALLLISPPTHTARAERPPRKQKIIRNDGRITTVEPSALTYSPSHAVTITPDQLKNEPVPHRDLLVFAPNPHRMTENGISPNSIIGPDERVRVPNTSVYPYSAIVELIVEFPYATAQCSGWMIGANQVATAGHCLNYAGLGGWATAITAYPGRDGTNAPFGSVAAANWSVPNRWVKRQNPGVDYGVIQLTSSIGNTVGFFGYQYNDRDGFFVGRRVTVSGYPGDKVGAEANTQWKMQGSIDRATERRLFYEIDTYGGQSGSPMYGTWGRRDCSPCGFGIHTYGVGGSWSENSATRITKSVFDFFQSAGAP